MRGNAEMRWHAEGILSLQPARCGSPALCMAMQVHARCQMSMDLWRRLDWDRSDAVEIGDSLVGWASGEPNCSDIACRGSWETAAWSGTGDRGFFSKLRFRSLLPKDQRFFV